MPRFLSYIRPFRYDRVSRIAVVETGPAHLFAGVLEELRRLFPESHIVALLREEDAALEQTLQADRAHVVRFEERAEIVAKLRREPFDLVVMQLSRGGAEGLRSLPFVLSGNAIMAFNDSLDHFPLNVFRLPDLANHFGLASQGAGLVLAPVLFAYLLVSSAGIHVRGWWRRLRRPRRPKAGGVVVAGASSSPGATDVERSRAAAGSESA